MKMQDSDEGDHFWKTHRVCTCFFIQGSPNLGKTGDSCPIVHIFWRPSRSLRFRHWNLADS